MTTELCGLWDSERWKLHHPISSCPLVISSCHGLNGERKAVYVPMYWRPLGCLTNLDFLNTQEKLWFSDSVGLSSWCSCKNSLFLLCVLYRLELTWCLPCKGRLFFFFFKYSCMPSIYHIFICLCMRWRYYYSHVFRCKREFSGENTEAQD